MTMTKTQVLALLKENKNERGIANWKKLGSKTGQLKSFGIGLTQLRKLAKHAGNVLNAVRAIEARPDRVGERNEHGMSCWEGRNEGRRSSLELARGGIALAPRGRAARASGDPAPRGGGQRNC